MIEENKFWQGKVKVYILDGNGELVDVVRGHNKVTNVGKNLLCTALGTASNGSIVDTAIKYMAWGTSNAHGTEGEIALQTTLQTEVGRKAVSSGVSGTTGQFITKTYLGSGDANVSIAELGWFAGPNASATAGSGVMIGRCVLGSPIVKNSGMSIIMERDDLLT